MIEKLIRACDSADLWKALKDKVQAYVNQELKKPDSTIAAIMPQSRNLSQNKAIVAYARTFHESDQQPGGPGLLGKMVDYESSLGDLTKVCGGVAEGCENDESYDDLKE